MRGLIVAALMVSALPMAQAHAQTAPAAQADAEPAAERFFASLKRHDVKGALDGLATQSPLLFKDKDAARAEFTDQIENIYKLYGDVIRWERVKTEMVGTLVRRDTYLVLHRGSIIRWRIIYSKLNSNSWTISNIDFDEQRATWF